MWATVTPKRTFSNFQFFFKTTGAGGANWCCVSVVIQHDNMCLFMSSVFEHK